jgi:hypothetical protein
VNLQGPLLVVGVERLFRSAGLIQALLRLKWYCARLIVAWISGMAADASPICRNTQTQQEAGVGLCWVLHQQGTIGGA